MRPPADAELDAIVAGIEAELVADGFRGFDKFRATVKVQLERYARIACGEDETH